MTPSRTVNRRQRKLKADALNGQDVVIFAPRRYGKSSLIWRVSQELIADGALVAHVNLMTTPTITQLAEKLARTIHDDIASPMFRAKERLRIFQGLRIRPTVTVDPEDGSLSFSFDAGKRKEDINATLERLLELPGQLAGERRRPVVLILDEFQEVVDIDPSLPRLMRSVFQQQPEVAHFYLGSKRHMMERIFSDENEPFWRSAKEIASRDRAAALRRLHRAAVQTHGQADRPGGRRRRPAHHERTSIRRPRSCATSSGRTRPPAPPPQMCRSAKPFSGCSTPSTPTSALCGRALLPISGFCCEHWPKSLGIQSQRIYRRRHALPGGSSVQRALGALEKAELIGRRRGEAWISEPFLAQWLLLNEV